MSTSVAEAEAAASNTPRRMPSDMAAKNLVVRATTDRQRTEVPLAEAEGVSMLMSQASSNILASMARDGWEVKPLSAADGRFEMVLPSVRVSVLGAVVSIPPPRFLVHVWDTCERAGAYEERLQGELVLQNGEDILTVELGFPFNRTIQVSAAGSAICEVGSEPQSVILRANVEIGLDVPKLPGLAHVMECFVRTYANNSALDCTRSLASSACELLAANEVEETKAVADNKMEMPTAKIGVASTDCELDALAAYKAVGQKAPSFDEEAAPAAQVCKDSTEEARPRPALGWLWR